MSVENNLPFEDYSGELEEARWKLEESQTRLRSLKIMADDGFVQILWMNNNNSLYI